VSWELVVSVAAVDAELVSAAKRLLVTNASKQMSVIRESKGDSWVVLLRFEKRFLLMLITERQ
jgi:hypothetical protein